MWDYTHIAFFLWSRWGAPETGAERAFFMTEEQLRVLKFALFALEEISYQLLQLQEMLIETTGLDKNDTDLL